MPLLNIPSDLIKEKNKLYSTGSFIELLELELSEDSSTLRIANNNETITWDSKTWDRFAFIPGNFNQTDDGELSSVEIKVSNVGRVVQGLIESAGNDNLIGDTVNYYLVHSGNLDKAAAITIVYSILEINCNDEWCVFTLGMENFFFRKFPLNVYRRNTCRYPVFRGTQCQYIAPVSFTTWSKISDFGYVTGPESVWSNFYVYNNLLYIGMGGIFTNNSSAELYSYDSLTSVGWEFVYTFGSQISRLNSIIEHNSDLILCSGNSTDKGRVTRYSVLDSIPAFTGFGVQGNNVWDIVSYNGQLYMSWTKFSVDGIIKVWDESSAAAPNTFINVYTPGSLKVVRCLTEYQGILYAGSYIGKGAGHFHRFDGTASAGTWSIYHNFGSDYNNVNEMFVFNDKLYITTYNETRNKMEIHSYDGNTDTFAYIQDGSIGRIKQPLVLLNDKYYVAADTPSEGVGVYSFDVTSATLTMEYPISTFDSSAEPATRLRTVIVHNGLLYVGVGNDISASGGAALWVLDGTPILQDPAISCNRTFVRCLQLDNQERFGGQPSIPGGAFDTVGRGF